MTKKIIIFLAVVLTFCFICNNSGYLFVKAINAGMSEHNNEMQIDDYILVTMKNEYSFPAENYSPAYFGEKYVKEVIPIFTYCEESLIDKEVFCRGECLVLTEYGKMHIDDFISDLINRKDVQSAEKDYSFQGIEEDSFSDMCDFQINAEPIDDYILVTMSHAYSFPEKDYGPSYFGDEYVRDVESIFTYQEGALIDRDKFCRGECLYLTEYGKAHADSFIEGLLMRTDILAVERDYSFQNGLEWIVPNDVYFQDQYALDNIMCQKAWTLSTGASTIRIGILDSGITASHPDLSSNVNTNLSYDFVLDTAGSSDAHGHGTCVAGIIGARGNNNIGVCGITWYSTLISLRVADEEGHWTNQRVTSAVNYASNNNIHILNMSLGNGSFSFFLRNALNAYTGISVVASGNDGENGVDYPANYNLDNMVVVAAVDQDDELTEYSNYHSSKVHLAAPGDYTYTTKSPSSYTNNIRGTSFAAPHVAGTLALMRFANTSLTATQLKEKLLAAVDPIVGLSGKVSTGGRLNSFRAVRLAKGYLMGDADLDGSIDPSDARQILRWSLGLDFPTNQNEALSDVNYDNILSPADAQLVLQVSLGVLDPIQ